LLAPRPNPRLDDHPLSAVRDCLFNIFAATLHIWRPCKISAFGHEPEVYIHTLRMVTEMFAETDNSDYSARLISESQS
jgi:hypothetical protein